MKKLWITNTELYATVDDDDYTQLASSTWGVFERKLTGYTKRYVYRKGVGSKAGGTEYLHRIIMNCPKGMVVDHIDGDTLNNTRANLRVCTHQENSRNRALQKGRVGDFAIKPYETKYSGIKYRVRFQHTSKTFSTIEQARTWYNDEKKKLYKNDEFITYN